MTLAEQLVYAAPELILAIGGMVLLLVGVFMGDQRARVIMFGAVALLLAAAASAAMLLEMPSASIFSGAFAVDGYAIFAKVIVFVAAAISILMSSSFLGAPDLKRFEYPILIVFAAFGMGLMTSASDLITLYLGLEAQSLALYILATFNRDNRRSTEAGLKYFVLGALSSCLLLYGASLVYGFAGSTRFEDIAKVASLDGRQTGLLIGLVFVISGLAFKISAAPFHMWTPDVYEGAPTPVTAFFAAAPKLAAMALFGRFIIQGFQGAIDDWRPIVAALSVASMLVGAFSAITQTNIKRLMAYSSIGHMGYALIGLAAGTVAGVSSVLVYMAIYIAMTLGTFACILLMRRRGEMVEEVSDLAGAARTNLPLAVMMTVFLFSLAGIPPLAGFFGKWFVFVAAAKADLLWLAIVGAVISVISCYYYLRVVWFMWFNDPAPTLDRSGGFILNATATVSALLMFPLFLGLIAMLNDSARGAAAALFG
ncbi:MAG: NADH-quinone oxidoreductase subunit NuoN [Parvularculaceae bacterium]|nr:NADH-quinone oxidoreductase subunit NuoN [Parvularculaceae bacterium]